MIEKRSGLKNIHAEWFGKKMVPKSAHTEASQILIESKVTYFLQSMGIKQNYTSCNKHKGEIA